MVHYNAATFQKEHLTYFKADSSLVTGRIISSRTKDTTVIFHYNQGKPSNIWYIIYHKDTIASRRYFNLSDKINLTSKYKFESINIYEEKFGQDKSTVDLRIETFNSPQLLSFLNKSKSQSSTEFHFFKSLLDKTNELLNFRYEVGYARHYEGDTIYFSQGYGLKSPFDN